MLKSAIKRGIIASGLEVAHVLQTAGLLRGARGRGVIFTLHHVRPYAHRGTNTIRHLEITPEFLDAAIRRLKADGYRFVRLDEVPDLLGRPDDDRPFAVFTLDDGFIDNAVHAMPVFARHQVPFTIFVCEGFSERTHTLWWETLDLVVNRLDNVTFDCGAGPRQFALTTPSQRVTAALAIGAAITSGREADGVARLDHLARENGIDPLALTAELVMDRKALAELARQPLVTLGAHTVSHRSLARMAPEEAEAEMRHSRAYVSSAFGDRHGMVFAYPYGDERSVSDATIAAADRSGFAAAVTTRPGTMAPGQSLKALPRVSLNGFFQAPRYAAALASGIPFKLIGG
ncbi:polysaccharide deacetylase family protein [Rhizobium halophytocola]|uniref:Chitooligosaccharide deacetylase n=1 Tax=Rhizobium halophytocola TaxID=735519 RepID=A0ABS4DX98_9HYPH|nr:polysaccharide deacetylase family protein [Rhizobium halophytocola]MBP1850322.1 peptidoglycan/xylan/chitin deacetylase (PgdA/CDA1 family) [Rhizobium halophytocola]